MTLGDGAGFRAEQLSLPQDSLGFVRRECPTCHRLFKTKANRGEGALLFQRVADRIAHENDHEVWQPMAWRACPYCGVRASSDRWLTAEQRVFIDKRANAFRLEVRYQQLAHVERTLAANPNPTFLPVRPAGAQARLDPEPNDLRVVQMFCCGEEIKIYPSWLGPVFCFRCGTEHELASALVRDRLSRIF